jgi:hypothetical protein
MDYLTSTKIADLQKIAKQRTGVATFIGAGCSAVLKIPLWDELLIGLNQEFNFYAGKEAVLDAIKNDGYPKVASNIAKGADETKYREVIKKFTQPVACHFTSLHIELVRLSKLIITTNYDASFEETLDALDRCSTTSDWKYAKFGIGYFSFIGLAIDRQVFHIHGESTTGNVVLTEESYLEQYNRPTSGVKTLISAVFSSLSTVFVGFSFSDKDFMTFLESAWEDIRAEKKSAGAILPQHYCILSDNYQKDYFYGNELELDNDGLNEWISKGILLRDTTRVFGETVFGFTNDAPALIANEGLDDKLEARFLGMIRNVDDNRQKLELLKKLDIEVIYFEGNNYLQIELILRKLNEPLAAAAAAYKP